MFPPHQQQQQQHHHHHHHCHHHLHHRNHHHQIKMLCIASSTITALAAYLAKSFGINKGKILLHLQ